MESIVSSGATIEEAIAAGLKRLGVKPEEVMVEVLEEPSSGYGDDEPTPALVRLILMSGRNKDKNPYSPTYNPDPTDTWKPQGFDDTWRNQGGGQGQRRKPQGGSRGGSGRGAPPRNNRRQGNNDRRGGGRNDRRNDGERSGGRGGDSRNNDRRSGGRNDRRNNGDRRGGRGRDDRRGGGRRRDDRRGGGGYSYDLITEHPENEIQDENASQEAVIGKKVLYHILEHMGKVDTYVSIHKAERDSGDEVDYWILNISGEKLDALVGRRGETLASLQYLVRLIVSRELEERSSIIVDVGQYKSRRSNRLEKLAKRMADKAIDEQRTISLEPMPPHERRIVHLALRDREDVETMSVGDGNSRKVTITPLLQ